MDKGPEKQKKNYPLIAKLALQHGLVPEEDLKKAVYASQEKKNATEGLGRYLVENDLVSKQNLSRLQAASKAMVMRKRDIRFGAIAIQKGLVSKTVLELALEEQKNRLARKKATPVGDLLVEAGIITATQRDCILKEQKRLKTITRENETGRQPVTSGKNETNGDQRSGKKTPRPDPAPESQPPSLETTIMGMKLTIPGDASAAYLSKTDDFDDSITVRDIKQLLDDQLVVNGIVDDSLISGFIRSSGFREKPFRAAKGLVPRKGTDAKIDCFFDTDHLKAGHISDSGEIDFRERGEIPQIQEGFVLAKKTPLTQEQAGKNIHGEITTVPPAKDAKLKYGKGTRLSQDCLKVIATTDGQPKLSWSGVFSVLDEFITNGDVNYETGHINYQGNVKIKGRIKNGFKVNGNNIRTMAIDGGIVNAEGDLSVSDGINEAIIFAKGHVWAKYIHNSTILSMGNIFCTKEIVETRIETSGACIAKQGKIIHSTIIAKMGIYARDIGSKRSQPCTLGVGTDIFVLKELERLKTEISGIRKEIARQKEKRTEIMERSKAEQENSTKLAHLQDRSQLDQKSTITKIAGLDRVSDMEEIKEMKARLQQMKTSAKNAEQQLNQSFDAIDLIHQEITRVDEVIALKTDMVEELIEEQSTLGQMAKQKPGIAIIEATGTLMEGTLVKGRHSELRMERNSRNTKIKEVQLSNPEDKKQEQWWEMRIVPR
ncbi:MAG: flagellar assembly protein A [Desulfobacteraceae bacterium]